ncbi:MAG: phosphomannomutase/phosphoglucomutase [Ilumatobacteraceae bacterium]|jgi:phosphomannomutase|nr:phosphomannomutase/phosphoglucomutase [Acidimicrobiaceae bacterium]MBP6487344.1 phosphomannomutase/phosphoglucomutase [Ilumatobacteraceae bacterium]MBP7888157.1 phosphomannomutase/phosphoglucomutase [Ilumatobacteraceae bacterium]MBP8210087.1 phosphomannomutase/phosphoglucomutase [Ilumatobacteraceae bacterium]HAN34297.1 phosphomannomutase/phosphoglucomutase [Acidimicrobiaceae bacterium]
MSPTDPRVLDDIVKAYDVRGTVPDQINTDVAYALGVGFARFCQAPRVLVARDMRPSGPELVDAFSRGVMEHGSDVVDLGLASTDLMYYAAGTLDAPGAMFTASHNPAGYNGVKFCLSGARPVGVDTGLDEVKRVAGDVLEGHGPLPAATAGSQTSRNLLEAFADHVVSFVDVASLRALRVVADTANGMGGLVVPAVFERLPQITLEVMYGELDGTFPNHPADPLQPANQRDLQARVVAGGFDIGLAFDGDADRVFVVDEAGRGLSGSTTTALLAAAVLRANPGATILYNLICSRAVPEVIREQGGVPVRTKVGHSFIKQRMAETGAVFGGEHSAHYYFLKNFRADSGLIASMLVLNEVSRAHTDLSVLRKPFERYSSSGEINTQVADTDAVIEKVAAQFAGFEQDHLDGLTVDCGPWWFNLRPSNTEPLLRLNLEAPNRDECDQHVAELLALITSL